MSDPERFPFLDNNLYRKSTPSEVALLLPNEIRQLLGVLSPSENAGLHGLSICDIGPQLSEFNMMRIKYIDEEQYGSTQLDWEYVEPDVEDEPEPRGMCYTMKWTEFGMAVSRECYRLLQDADEEEIAQLERLHADYLQTRPREN